MSITKNILKGKIRIYLSDYTEIAQMAINKHETLPLASLTLGTAVAVFGPLGLMKKHGKVLTHYKFDGPLEEIMVESTIDGLIRANIKNPKVVTDYDKKDINAIPIKVGLGNTGQLKITNMYGEQSFGGMVEMFKGDITSDLAFYFDQSEQTSSAVLSSVRMKNAKTVERAYSCIFQLMPGCTEEEIAELEKFIKYHKLSDYNIHQFEELIDGELQIEYKTRWQCNCSKPRMKNILQMLSQEERHELLQEHGVLEIKCNFCNETYKFNSV